MRQGDRVSVAARQSGCLRFRALTAMQVLSRLKSGRSFLVRGVRRACQAIASGYFAATQRHPLVTLAAISLVVAALGAFVGRFELDASADSLVLERDKDLEYYRDIRRRYGSDDFVVVTYRPQGTLFDEQTLGRIRSLRRDLAGLERVTAVTSMLDVPLLAGRTFSDLQDGTRTLLSPDVDLDLARREFTSSRLYRNVLVGEDGEIAGLHVYFEQDRVSQELLRERDALRELRRQRELTPVEKRRLAEVSRRFRERSAQAGEQLHQDIGAIRDTLDGYRDHADIHLAGVPMIVSDMIRFIGRDLRVFGAAVLGFIVVLLAVSFRRPRWVAVPVLVCAAAAIGMLGGLGLIGKPVTVVSSNFLPVLLIVTLSLTVHLIVRHEELRERHPHADSKTLVAQTMRDKFAPCLYTALTTIVAFASLVVSGIRPVIDFGWLMVIGIACAFVLVFLAFPAALALLPAARPVRRRYDITGRVTTFLVRLVDHRAATTLVITALLFALGAAGIPRLSVENRFIDYFDESTEIHQGMVTIDRELGGTTPLDVILDAPGPDGPKGDAIAGDTARPGLGGASYWFNMFRLDTVKRVHDYLDSLPETGKVLSLATSVQLLEQLNGGRALDSFTLLIVHKRLPEDIRRRLFDPYMSADGNQLRFAVRMYESDPGLRRGELLRKIRSDLVERFGLAPAQVHVTGMAVLYNNMLQSLFRSQVLTFGFVLVAVFLMFLALFRSLRVSAIALVPNLLVAAMVLGLMGWLRIPLDMMTTTIAAIAMGIAVDDTIHYTHRFREELAEDGDYWAAAKRSHRSVGRAIFYTSITITLGFAILVLSNFVPTITFGLLVGAAMSAALIADLTVLPVLFAVFRPFGRSGAR
jgi:predicted RND superfamily exporter protein